MTSYLTKTHRGRTLKLPVVATESIRQTFDAYQAHPTIENYDRAMEALDRNVFHILGMWFQVYRAEFKPSREKRDAYVVCLAGRSSLDIIGSHTTQVPEFEATIPYLHDPKYDDADPEMKYCIALMIGKYGVMLDEKATSQTDWRAAQWRWEG